MWHGYSAETRANVSRKLALKLSQGPTSPVRDAVLGNALRLLYLAGLRAGEFLRLTQADVNLDAGLLHIRYTKFDKSRMVPIALDLAQHLM